MADDPILKHGIKLRPRAEIGLEDPTGGGGVAGGPSMAGAREALASKIAKPAIKKGDLKSMVEKIFQFAEQVRNPAKEYAKPVTDPAFAPADPALTKELVPQRSMRAGEELPPMPTSKKWPGNDRARQIWDAREQIANQLVKDLMAKGGGALPFYSTGTVLSGLSDKAGLSPEQAVLFMRDWAGQGAATSPRTETPSNLRNASYLLWRQAQGDPFHFTGEGAGANRPGFPMMKMHTDLAGDFAKGTVDPWHHTKPYVFRENWSGNMADVTGDTHNFRKILDAYDRLFPGTLARGWFNSQEAYDAYTANKGFPKTGVLPVGDIKDSVQSQSLGGRETQTEYPVMTAPTYLAAQKMGISPAEAQERLWFEGGPRTNLGSPPSTIPDLLNSQIETTARVLGIPVEQIIKLWGRRGIPLAQNEPLDVPGASAVG